MKHFTCGTLVPGCQWHTSADDESEVIRRVVAHLHSAHDEETVRPQMIERIKARITDQPEPK